MRLIAFIALLGALGCAGPTSARPDAPDALMSPPDAFTEVFMAGPDTGQDVASDPIDSPDALEGGTDAADPPDGPPDVSAPDAPEEPPDVSIPPDVGPVCPEGQDLCDGTCQRIDTPERCGGCLIRCGPPDPARHYVPLCEAPEVCRYVCEDGYGDSDGNVTNGCEEPLGSPRHCGACGDRCTTGRPCILGRCY